MAEFETFDQVILALQKAKRILNDHLNAFEFMEGKIVKRNAEEYKLSTPFNVNDSHYYALIEACGQEQVEQTLERLGESLLEDK
jgi:hypothetical protein